MSETDTLERRWARPLIPLAVEPDTSGNVRHVSGHWRHDYVATFTEDDKERIREGRACLKCWEPQEEAFPDNCPLCGYGMRENQPYDYQDAYGGEKHIGPSTSISEELDRLDWTHDERMWVKYGAKGILVPRGVSAGS